MTILAVNFRILTNLIARSQLNLLLIAIATCLLTLTSCNQGALITPPIQADLGGSLNSQFTEINPQFSQNGRYLVFTSDRYHQSNIFLYDVQNKAFINLPGLNQANNYYDQPDINADGRYLVYISEQSGKPDVWLYDRQISKATNLTNNLVAEVRHPTISGDGRFVAFEVNRFGQWDLSIYDRGTEVISSPPQ